MINAQWFLLVPHRSLKMQSNPWPARSGWGGAGDSNTQAVLRSTPHNSTLPKDRVHRGRYRVGTPLSHHQPSNLHQVNFPPWVLASDSVKWGLCFELHLAKNFEKILFFLFWRFLHPRVFKISSETSVWVTSSPPFSFHFAWLALVYLGYPSRRCWEFLKATSGHSSI